MNTVLRRKAKSDFEKDFLDLMNNAAFGKTIENVRKHRDMKLVTTGRRRNYLVSQSNYHTPKFFTEHLIAIEMKTTQILMNKPVYLGLSILEISKKKLQKMQKVNFIIQIMNQKDRYQKGKNKQVIITGLIIGLMKDELGGKMMKKLLD